MKILHTADLHLGHHFNGISLEDDHGLILDQLACAVTEHSIDALIIAGDIFDRASPPASAVRQFNNFLQQIAEGTDAAVIMIAGNHDSGDRIASMSIMTDKARAHIRGAVSADERPFILTDEHGPVAFSGLPFSHEYAARECFEDESIQTPADVLTAQIFTARANVPKDTRWIVIAHAFVSGAKHSESERSLTRVGGIETVRPEVFEGAHYVALGHLHRPQKVGTDNIRYSGSPLAFGFDEADAQKSMCVIDLNKDGVIKFETIPFKPMRNVRVIRGKHAELLDAESSTDFVKAVLTDNVPIIDGMKRLREIFPNVCDLTYERNERTTELVVSGSRPASLAKPSVVVDDFVRAVRAESIDDAERAVIATALQELQNGEDAA